MAQFASPLNVQRTMSENKVKRGSQFYRLELWNISTVNFEQPQGYSMWMDRCQFSWLAIVNIIMIIIIITMIIIMCCDLVESVGSQEQIIK